MDRYGVVSQFTYHRSFCCLRGWISTDSGGLEDNNQFIVINICLPVPRILWFLHGDSISCPRGGAGLAPTQGRKSLICKISQGNPGDYNVACNSIIASCKASTLPTLANHPSPCLVSMGASSGRVLISDSFAGRHSKDKVCSRYLST